MEIKINIVGNPEIIDITPSSGKRTIIRGAMDLVCENKDYLIKKWSEIHG